MFAVLVICAALSVGLVLSFSRPLRRAMSPFYGPIFEALPDRSVVKQLGRNTFSLVRICLGYMGIGLFFAFFAGGFGWFTDLSPQYPNLMTSAILGIMLLAVSRILSLTVTTFFLDTFHVLILATLALMPFAFALFPTCLLGITDRFVAPILLQGPFVPSLILTSVVTMGLTEYAMHKRTSTKRPRYVPVSLGKEFTDRFQYHEQYLLRGNVTEIFRDRIQKRAERDGYLDIKWVSKSATPELLEILRGLSGTKKASIHVISLKGNADRIWCALSPAGCINLEVYTVSEEYMSRPRFMIINGREVIRSMPIPSDLIEEPLTSTQSSNLAYCSTSPSDISDCTAIFEAILRLGDPFP